MTWLPLVVAALATFRLTRLITTDLIGEPLRMAAARRFPPYNRPHYDPLSGQPKPDAAGLRPHWLPALLCCDWCLSVWIAAGVVGALHGLGFLVPWQSDVLAWWGIAGAAGLLAHWSAK